MHTYQDLRLINLPSSLQNLETSELCLPPPDCYIIVMCFNSLWFHCDLTGPYNSCYIIQQMFVRLYPHIYHFFLGSSYLYHLRFSIWDNFFFCLLYIHLQFLLGLWLIYTVVLVSGIQQSESVYMCVNVYTHSFLDSFFI